MLKVAGTIRIMGYFTFLVLAMTVHSALCEHGPYNSSTTKTVLLEVPKMQQWKPCNSSTTKPVLLEVPKMQQPKVGEPSWYNQGVPDNSNLTAENAHFLIAEKTPVWYAYAYDKSGSFQYTRKKELMVKEAIDAWRPLKWKSDYSEIHKGYRDTFNTPPAWPYDEVVYLQPGKPSVEHDLHVLISMDYPKHWPTNAKNEEKYMKEKIVYAVAFWNAIHMRLKKTINPRLRIRIDGIVLVHWRDRQEGMDLTLREEQRKTFGHWKLIPIHDKAGNRMDYPTAVFTMTNSHQPEGSDRWNIITKASPLGDVLVGVIYDDLKYYGMTGFTANDKKMMKLLAQASTPSLRPKAYEQPGKPIVNPPMPGEVMTINQQCHASGFHVNNQVSVYYNWCHTFRCASSGQPWLQSAVDHYRWAVDGSACDSNKVCLEGQCVRRNDNTLSYKDDVKKKWVLYRYEVTST